MNTLQIPAPIWVGTWEGLCRRGGGRREAVAVWGGTRSSGVEVVTSVVFADDFVGAVGDACYHRVPAQAVTQILAQLRQRGEVIIADVHTHPGRGVGLSAVDKKNPIEFRVGLFSLVLPNFARGRPGVEVAGIHSYLGGGQWKALSAEEVETRVRIVGE